MLGREDILTLRLRSLLLPGLLDLNRGLNCSPGAESPGPKTARNPAQVAHHFLSMQAQDFAASLWALGARSGAPQAEVEQAYQQGKVVRSWPMRGTLHTVPAEDIGWLQRLTAAKVLGAGAERRRQHLGLEPAHIEKVREAVTAILAGGRALSREDLMAAVAARGVEVAATWKYHLIWYLAQTGTLVFGPAADGRPLLVLASEWIAAPRALGRDEALAELAARYTASHGPATEDDLAWWSGLGKRDVRAALALAGSRVARERADDGAEYWLAPDLHDADRAASAPTVELLPAFDEHLLGYRDRTVMLDPAHAAPVCPGGNGVFKPTVVVDGVCAGTWRPIARGALGKLRADRPVPVAVTWFDKVAERSADPALLAGAANRYARYLGREWAEVTVAGG
ncbi:MAG: winged helix DNA-binding domain-containing protein [Bifidobacteriaceae bacterium]|jgi:hypothetical protein|nr:winged helix DNA-binding domain-containing protein [Bifidobacteriaceae bacterium]